MGRELNSAGRFQHPIIAQGKPMQRESGRSNGTRVVSVGRNSNLLALRQAVLELGGFNVLSTSSMPVARAVLSHQGCGVLILCYSVSENCKQILTRLFREHCPEGRIVGIIVRDQKSALDGFDEVLFSTDKADALLEAVSGERGRKKAV